MGGGGASKSFFFIIGGRGAEAGVLLFFKASLFGSSRSPIRYNLLENPRYSLRVLEFEGTSRQSFREILIDSSRESPRGSGGNIQRAFIWMRRSHAMWGLVVVLNLKHKQD